MLWEDVLRTLQQQKRIFRINMALTFFMMQIGHTHLVSVQAKTTLSANSLQLAHTVSATILYQFQFI